MKKFLRCIRYVLVMIIAIPLLLIVFINWLLLLPFNIIRYHRMPYYKDLGIKYQAFITSRDSVKIYNHIVRQQLPIEYVKNNDLEYFIREDQVLLCGWGYEEFEKVDEEWFFIFECEYDNKLTMKEVIEKEIEKLKPEHRHLPIKFLIMYDNIDGTEKFEKAKECPYFYCVFSMEKDI